MWRRHDFFLARFALFILPKNLYMTANIWYPFVLHDNCTPPSFPLPPYPFLSSSTDSGDPLERLLSNKSRSFGLNVARFSSCRFRLVVSSLCVQRSLGLLVTPCWWPTNFDCYSNVSFECGKPQILRKIYRLMTVSVIIIHQKFSFARDWFRRVALLNISHLNWGISQFSKPRVLRKLFEEQQTQ